MGNFSTRLMAMGAGFQGQNPAPILQSYQDALDREKRKANLDSLLGRMDISGTQRGLLESMPVDAALQAAWGLDQQRIAQARAQAAAARQEEQYRQRLASLGVGQPQQVAPFGPTIDAANAGATSGADLGQLQTRTNYTVTPEMLDRAGLLYGPDSRTYKALENAFERQASARPDWQVVKGADGRNYMVDKNGQQPPRLAIPGAKPPASPQWRPATAEEAAARGAISGQFDESGRFYPDDRSQMRPDRETATDASGILRYMDTGDAVFEEDENFTPKADTKAITDFRKEWVGLPAVRSYAEQSAAYGRIVEAGKDPSAAGDLALIFNYMKILDPGSTVREGEFATAQNSAGLPDRLRAQYNQIINGQRLESGQRNDFLDRARRLYTSAEQYNKYLLDVYREIAGEQGLPVEQALIDFTYRAADSQGLLPTPPLDPQVQSDLEKYGGTSK